ncbi:MAG: M1 family metallopeptidase [Sandaracinaceae bacterium]|nr:M1 family metallopeptidase [Sandaracinaceae bacterium]
MTRPHVLCLLTLTSLLAVGCGGASAEEETQAQETSGLEVIETPAPAAAPVDVTPTGPLPDGITPLRYALDLEVVPSRDTFSGTVDIRVRLEHPSQRIYLHGTGMTVSEAWIAPGFEGDLANGPLRARPTSALDARFETTDHEGVDRVVTELPVGPGEVTIHLRYEAPFDRQLKGLYRVDVGNDHYAFTQFEPTSARYAFPSFDEPRFKTPFDLTLRVPENERGVANTHEIENVVEGGMRRLRFAPTEPLPTYLVAMAVGPLDIVEGNAIPANDVRSSPLPFRGVCARGRGAELRYAMEHTAAIVASLERWTGVAYPYDKLDIVAVPDFASGAMENAGLITFRETFLLLPPQPGEDHVRAFTSIMAHELAHHWFGDLVTMPWWDDIWLNEAFATYMATRTVADVAPEQNATMSEVASTHGAMGADSLASARRIRQPIESDHDIRNAFDAITYQKGAAVIAMFERFVGPDVFRAGIHRYLEEHRFGTATAEDLLLTISREAGRDVTTPFRTFLDQPGVPLVHADLACGEGGNVVMLSQERFTPLGFTPEPVAVTTEGEAPAPTPRWQIPVCVRFGRGRETGEVCTLLNQESARLDLPAGACPEWIHPNANASGYYRFAMPADDLDALVTRGYAQLGPRERLSLANNVRAMVGAGTSDVDAVMALLPRFAGDPERLVAVEPFGLLQSIVDDLVDDTHRGEARAWVASLYAPRFRRLGWTARARESGDDRLLRRDLVHVLTRIAHEPTTSARAAELGRGYLGRGTGRAPHDGQLHPEAVQAELLAIVTTAAVNDPQDPPCPRGEACVASGPSAAQVALFEHVLSLAFASDDGTVRQRLLASASSVEVPALAERALELTLDPRLRVNELGIPMGLQAETPAGRRRALAWVSGHLPQLRERFATTRLGYVPWTFSGLCTADERAAVSALFTPVITEWPGGPRNLAGTLEAMSMCIARRERQSAPALRYFDAH